MAEVFIDCKNKILEISLVEKLRQGIEILYHEILENIRCLRNIPELANRK
jgi:hypothetical protein